MPKVEEPSDPLRRGVGSRTRRWGWARAQDGKILLGGCAQTLERAHTLKEVGIPVGQTGVIPGKSEERAGLSPRGS
ncbi:hypothetical protein GCM10023405_34320 [Streptomonospora salina]